NTYYLIQTTFYLFMAKQQISFVCQECGYDSPQWLGRCPECGNWNTLREIKIGKSAANNLRSIAGPVSLIPKKLSEINYSQTERIKTGFSELDSVFGGGIVAGSVTLIAGDPGVGKSTL